MNTATAGFGGELVQRRGGIVPGSPPQERCDACDEPLNPQDATEVTIATPATSIRVYAHGRCQEALAARVSVLITGVRA